MLPIHFEMKHLILLLLIAQTKADFDQTDWFNDFIEIKQKLADGDIPRIKNALPKHLLDFDYKNIEWEKRIGTNNHGKVWFTREECKSCAEPIEEWIMENKLFFNLIVPHRNISRIRLTLTKYSKGDYLELHNDYGGRLLSFILHLNKIPQKCGGDFIWAGGRGIKKAIVSPNTLYMFIPSTQTWHGIEQVHCNDRYAISGWFY